MGDMDEKMWPSSISLRVMESSVDDANIFRSVGRQTSRDKIQLFIIKNNFD